MNTKEAIAIFEELGWTPKLNVDRYAEREIEDRVVHVGFKVKDFTTFQKFEATYSLTTTEFIRYVKSLRQSKNANTLLKVNTKKTRFQEPEITREHIEIATNQAIEWATSVDIDARYEELCELDPSTPGAAGVWHLASLAIKGRSDTLLDYQNRFESGDNCGFVRFITQDYIDRAVVLAAQNFLST